MTGASASFGPNEGRTSRTVCERFTATGACSPSDRSSRMSPCSTKKSAPDVDWRNGQSSRMVSGSPFSVTQIFLPAAAPASSVTDPKSPCTVIDSHPSSPRKFVCGHLSVRGTSLRNLKSAIRNFTGSPYFPSSVERTFRARSSLPNGFCSRFTPGSSTLCCTTISSVYPVMYTILVCGRWPRMCSAN